MLPRCDAPRSCGRARGNQLSSRHPFKTTDFEAPSLLPELIKTRHGIRHVLEVLFHLLTKTRVEAVRISETWYTEIEVQDMVSVFAKSLPDKGGLRSHI